MTIDANTGQFISLTKAKEFVNNFKNLPGTGPVNSHFFGSNKLQQVLTQPGCIGLRMYYAFEEEQGAFRQQLVVVGVNSDGNDILDTNLILDFSATCPPHCPPPDKSL